jgi:hypothetical protein
MRIHVLRHVAFEEPAAIEDWARRSGHAIRRSRLEKGEALPDLTAFDLLIIMGGPMSVNDEEICGWLKEEKALVRKAIESGLRARGAWRLPRRADDRQCYGQAHVSRARERNWMVSGSPRLDFETWENTRFLSTLPPLNSNILKARADASEFPQPAILKE